MASTTEHASANVTRASIRRRFRLLDAMILVAATALGFGAIGWLARAANVSLQELSDAVSEIFPQQGRQLTAEGIATSCVIGLGLVTPLFAAWALALLPIRLISPRPRWRRLASRAGNDGSLLHGHGTGGARTCDHFRHSSLRRCPRRKRSRRVRRSHPSCIAGVIRPDSRGNLDELTRRPTLGAERSWIDRAGRALGCFWIVAGLLLMIFYISQEMRSQPFMTSTPVRLVSDPLPRARE